ncbi:hypothetical protein HanXRQr2_Chr15g0713571 [Helianthus annuus]|uniref:Uncharacterized protein n=1 Tax=Helianthus annuus TaxID=4232 RepID=A0A9K3E524_HELAN|nr:hypothetical protein HanXRQr2_Chr15g0713571 [Helianthus annuus]KAJ0832964.1 hypothetical protein HanPSC8_Chr15g0684771 [Helianthus annuus]
MIVAGISLTVFTFWLLSCVSLGCCRVLSWRTKLEKLLCLNEFGNKSLAKSAVFQTIKLVPISFHEITSSVSGSSTNKYVLLKKGAGADRLIIFHTCLQISNKFSKYYEPNQ